MRNHLRTRAALVLSSTLLVATPLAARTLTFEDRVEAQIAIERVHYRHQIGATEPFERAVSRRVAEDRVRTYLAQSRALETYWHAPITTEMLQHEMERMSRGTRLPDRLRELFAALGDDPFLVAECLARPALADRLSRSYFASDEGLHRAAREEAAALQAELDRSGDAAFLRDPRRGSVEAREVAEGSPEAEHRPGGLLSLSASKFARLRSSFPATVGVSSAREDRDGFRIAILLEGRPSWFRGAYFRVGKTTWDDWWTGVVRTFDARGLDALEGSYALPVVVSSESVSGCVPDDTWDNATLDDTPDGRAEHVAVWTGSEMLVWGGTQFPVLVQTGFRYDPATDSWSAMSRAGAPAPSTRAAGVWTGTRLIVWGGFANGGVLQSGGRYDPASDSWQTVTTVGAPAARSAAASVWTGSRLIVWGGYVTGGTFTNTGGRYDPVADAWTPTSTVGAPPGRYTTQAVWTGSTMVVWGGNGLSGVALKTGGRYDPASDTWLATSLTGVPSDRYDHVGVWTGGAFVVWGGYSTSIGNSVNTGGRYDPIGDTWTATATAGAPSPRQGPTALWSGSRMIVWGGNSTALLNTGGRYDPVTNTWTSTATFGAPSKRWTHTAVWTGSEMIVWGGSDFAAVATGGRYNPTTNTWLPTSTGSSAPSERANPTVVWTGSHMVVWGGAVDEDEFNTGSRYDPAQDTWAPTTLVGAPAAVVGHSAVWTGSRMIVWGGFGGNYRNTGGVYDPIADAWSATSTIGAPSRRTSHAAVWTGSRMVVWGGYDDSALGTGGRYDPATDTWSPVSTTGAPAARESHSGVWTGSKMIVWGGWAGSMLTGTGGIYDPATNAWTATTTVAAPLARARHSAVWTGSRMVVWGGDAASGFTDTGGRYDPASNGWSAITTTGSPTARSAHTATWTGTTMVVWGGYDSSTVAGTDTGGRYDPVADAWASTSVPGSPLGRGDHAAAWTGSFLIVWGGFNGAYLSSGGRYALGQTTDLDGDSYSSCQGDCADGNPAIHPGAAEACNQIDDNCDGNVDEDASGVDSDGDQIHNACDVCAFAYDPPQSDFDSDGEGDSCDLNDGVIYQLAPDPDTMAWQAESGASIWNLYEGDLDVLRATGVYTQAPGSNPLADRFCGLTSTALVDTDAPDPGKTMYSLVSAVVGGVETSLGTDSAGTARPNTNPCP